MSDHQTFKYWFFIIIWYLILMPASANAYQSISLNSWRFWLKVNALTVFPWFSVIVVLFETSASHKGKTLRLFVCVQIHPSVSADVPRNPAVVFTVTCFYRALKPCQELRNKILIRCRCRSGTLFASRRNISAIKSADAKRRFLFFWHVSWFMAYLFFVCFFFWKLRLNL